MILEYTSTVTCHDKCQQYFMLLTFILAEGGLFISPCAFSLKHTLFLYLCTKCLGLLSLFCSIKIQLT